MKDKIIAKITAGQPPALQEVVRKLEEQGRTNEHFLNDGPDFRLKFRGVGRGVDLETGAGTDFNKNYAAIVCSYAFPIIEANKPVRNTDGHGQESFTDSSRIISELKDIDYGADGAELIATLMARTLSANSSNFIELDSRELYPANRYNIGGQNFGQTAAVIVDSILPKYFAAAYVSGSTAMVNLDKNRPKHILAKGKTEKFFGNGERETEGSVTCTDEQVIKSAISRGSPQVVAKKYQFEKDGTTTDKWFIDIQNFADKRDEHYTDDAEREDYGDTIAKAIEFLDKQDCLGSGPIITNCSSGQNRALIFNSATAFYKVVKDLIQEIEHDAALTSDQKAESILALRDDLAGSIGEYGYNVRNLAIDTIRASIEAQAVISTQGRETTRAAAKAIINSLIGKAQDRVSELAVAEVAPGVGAGAGGAPAPVAGAGSAPVASAPVAGAGDAPVAPSVVAPVVVASAPAPIAGAGGASVAPSVAPVVAASVPVASAPIAVAGAAPVVVVSPSTKLRANVKSYTSNPETSGVDAEILLATIAEMREERLISNEVAKDYLNSLISAEKVLSGIKEEAKLLKLSIEKIEAAKLKSDFQSYTSNPEASGVDAEILVATITDRREDGSISNKEAMNYFNRLISAPKVPMGIKEAAQLANAAIVRELGARDYRPMSMVDRLGGRGESGLGGHGR